MLNYDLAKQIDKKTGSYNDPNGKINFKDILDQLSLNDIKNPTKCIQLKPELFLEEKEYLGEHDSAYIKVNNTKSKVNINVESLVTNEKYSFGSSENLRIKTPYPNKRIFTVGQIVDRKYKQSINFEPKSNEGIRFDSDIYQNIFNDKTINFRTQNYFKSEIFDLDFEISEYNYLYNESEENIESFSINDIDEEIKIVEDLEDRYTFTDYISDKYIIYPYKITEKWQLAFEIDVDSKDIEKNTSLSSPIEISYYICVLKYSNKYICEVLGNKKILFEVATMGVYPWQTTYSGVFASGGISKLGKIYSNKYQKQKTGVISCSETIKLDDFSIEQFTNIIPKIYEYPHLYDINVDRESQVQFHYPIVISMLPVLD